MPALVGGWCIISCTDDWACAWACAIRYKTHPRVADAAVVFVRKPVGNATVHQRKKVSLSAAGGQANGNDNDRADDLGEVTLFVVLESGSNVTWSDLNR